MKSFFLLLILGGAPAWAKEVACGVEGQVQFTCEGKMFPKEELSRIKTNLVALIDPVAKVLKSNRPTDLHFVIHFAPGPTDYPQTDENGRIHVYKLPFLKDSKFEFGTVHELTHRFLMELRNFTPPFNDYLLFLEEGFAEYVAEQVQYKKSANMSFPDFGAEAGFVIAEWIRTNRYLSIHELKSNFKKKSLTCTLQAYLGAKSFATFLVKKCGVESILDLLVTKGVSMSDCRIERKETLEKEWKAEMLRTFPRNIAKYEEFLSRRPKGYFELCEPRIKK